MNNTLSDKQLETLKLVAIYGGYKSVARELGCSNQAIKSSLERTRRKLNVGTTVQAVYKATKEGLI